MPYRFLTGPDDPCFATVWSGTITLETIRAYLADSRAARGDATDLNLLHDLRDAEYAIGLQELDVAKTFPQVPGDGKPMPFRRLALLVRTKVQFGLIRQILTKFGLAEHVLVTYSEAEARAFAGLPDHVALGPEA